MNIKMRTFITFVNGYQEVKTMSEARLVANENPLTIDIVEIDEDNLPEDVTVEDCINAAEDECIIRTTPMW